METKDINLWWKDLPGERFWLGWTRHEGTGEMLAVPYREGRDSRTSLIHHIDRGDLVFHYDDTQRAIVSWSVARHRVRRASLPWPSAHRSAEPNLPALPSWSIPLERAVPLDRVVSLTQVSRVQWDLFPALQEFEDLVGDPIYYPFAMGNPSETHLMPGHVFKLPALFVRNFPPMVHAAMHARWYEPYVDDHRPWGSTGAAAG